tara:strand:- start:952 stop:1377 length:426 start_codon:yes stop_codon:yes gene_type:complete
MRRQYIKILIIANFLLSPIALKAEPLVVLTYNNASELADRNNQFAQNPDFFAKHTIVPGESLNLIIQKYYDQSGLNMSFLQLAIISLNDHAFRNKNINYMIADETIHLPSINQISKLMKGIDFNLNTAIDQKNENIYFYGG